MGGGGRARPLPDLAAHTHTHDDDDDHTLCRGRPMQQASRQEPSRESGRAVPWRGRPLADGQRTGIVVFGRYRLLNSLPPLPRKRSRGGDSCDPRKPLGHKTGLLVAQGLPGRAGHGRHGDLTQKARSGTAARTSTPPATSATTRTMPSAPPWQL